MLKIKRKLEIPKLLECHSEIVHDEKRFLQAAVRSVFLGADLVNWLIKTYNPTEGDFKAIEKLIDEELYDPTLPHQLIYPVDMGLLGPGRRYYRFIEDQFIEYKKDPAIINLHGLDTSSLQFFYEQEQPESVFKAMDEFTEVLKEIYSEFGHDNGARIAYDELADSDLFNSKYLPLASKLAYLDLSPLIANEKYIKAFFINVYNGFAIHMVLARYGTKKKLEMSKIERFDALNHYKYNIGGHNYTLNDIQHGILRGNDSTGSSMPAAAMQFVFKVKTDSTPRFKERDPRFKYILRTSDPKIHFALNYGTTSCPPLRCYSAAEIDGQLDKAAKEFCTEDCEVKEVKGKKVICINQIFNWYCADFGKTKNDVLEFLLKCVQDESKRLEIIQMLEEVNNFNVEFKKSDMKTNVYKAAE